MANRSYLYATDRLPGSPEWEATRDLRSISEWNYDIPLTFKLLLSSNPAPVRSSIWETDKLIAVAGDARAGFEHLSRYLSRLPAEAASLVTEAQDFLSRPENTRNYFVMECGEIFEMGDGEPAAQNQALVAELQELAERIDSLAIPVGSSTKRDSGSFLKRLFGRTEPARPIDPLEPYYELGLGNWSNVLYFQFEEDAA